MQTMRQSLLLITSGTGNFDFEIGVSDTITWLETSRNFEITYSN